MPATSGRKRVKSTRTLPPVKIYLETVRSSDYDDDGFLGIQVDGDGKPANTNAEAEAPNEPRVATYEALWPLGMGARPLDPDTDEDGKAETGCLSLSLMEGSTGYSLPLHDARTVPILATLKPGESVLYGHAFNFFRCHEDGRASRMTTADGTKDGQTVFDQIGREGYLQKTPWSIHRVDETGYFYRHESGALVHGGSLGGLPSPLNAIAASYWEFQSGTFTVKSSAIKLGSGGAYEPVTKALVALEVLGLLATAGAAQATADTAVAATLNAILADLTTLLGPGNPTATAPVGAATVALGLAVVAHGTAAAGVAAAAVTLPARSVQVS